MKLKVFKGWGEIRFENFEGICKQYKKIMKNPQKKFQIAHKVHALIEKKKSIYIDEGTLCQ